MKKFLLLACLVVFTPAIYTNASQQPYQQDLTAIVYYGSITTTSNAGYTITTWVSYNPAFGILEVSVEDLFHNFLEVEENWSGTIYASGGVMYATGFRVNFTWPSNSGDYVILNGAFTMI